MFTGVDLFQVIRMMLECNVFNVGFFIVEKNGWDFSKRENCVCNQILLRLFF